MASKYRKKFSLPAEFYPILENYSREVLRDQPVDIVEFSYRYFKALEEVSLARSAFSDYRRVPSTSLSTTRKARTSRPASSTGLSQTQQSKIKSSSMRANSKNTARKVMNLRVTMMRTATVFTRRKRSTERKLKT